MQRSAPRPGPGSWLPQRAGSESAQGSESLRSCVPDHDRRGLGPATGKQEAGLRSLGGLRAGRDMAQHCKWIAYGADRRQSFKLKLHTGHAPARSCTCPFLGMLSRRVTGVMAKTSEHQLIVWFTMRVSTQQ